MNYRQPTDKTRGERNKKKPGLQDRSPRQETAHHSSESGTNTTQTQEREMSVRIVVPNQGGMGEKE